MKQVLFFAFAFAAAVVLFGETCKTRITGEIAARTATGWTLAHTPTVRPTCRLNGLTLGANDFTIAANAITSPWAAVIDSSDVLTCDYSYQGTL
jgi:hypothetical protein